MRVKVNSIAVIAIFFLPVLSYAQNVPEEQQYTRPFNSQESPINPYQPQNQKQKKIKKIKQKDMVIEDIKVAEYYQRMETNAKKYKKQAKELKKPQYTDPSYFGHKKKPKKRPPEKRKYCKECGMYH